MKLDFNHTIIQTHSNSKTQDNLLDTGLLHRFLKETTDKITHFRTNRKQDKIMEQALGNLNTPLEEENMERLMKLQLVLKGTSLFLIKHLLNSEKKKDSRDLLFRMLGPVHLVRAEWIALTNSLIGFQRGFKREAELITH